MVRIPLPNRLKSSNGKIGINGESQSGSRSSSPMRASADGKALVLKTTVLRARNLAAKDKNGTSDPFLVITLGDACESTPAINKTLNPEWNVSFDLPVIGPQSLLLEAICWDKDRFGKDYMGEFDIALEDIFADRQPKQEPQWYVLKSKRKSAKSKVELVSGDVQLQFAIADPFNPSAETSEIMERLFAFVNLTNINNDGDNDEILNGSSFGGDNDDDNDDDDDEYNNKELETSDETDDPTKPSAIEKRKKNRRLSKLKDTTTKRAYELTGGTHVVGIIFLDINKIVDLPPERNLTRTSFDMDPFVIASLGRKTYRTRVIRHNLNPVFEEKMVFQVMRHEQNYSLSFSVVDRDKLSGNDFVGTTSLAVSTLTENAPEADPRTGLYPLPEPPDTLSLPTPKSSRFKLPLSRSSSSQSLNKLAKPNLASKNSQGSMPTSPQADLSLPPSGILPDPNQLGSAASPANTAHELADESGGHSEGLDLRTYQLPIVLKNKDHWEDRHNPQLKISAKYLPYPALRQQFWRTMLRQYDSDENARISKIELTTMLDSLGSTLKESTIDSYFQRFAQGSSQDVNNMHLTFDQAVICLEDQLQRPTQKKSWGQTVRTLLDNPQSLTEGNEEVLNDKNKTLVTSTTSNSQPTEQDQMANPTITQDYLGIQGENGDILERDDLADDRDEEHVVEIRECPICHQPGLNKRSDADIITHLATCASQDWRQVNSLVMAGFVTSSQAQRKWYSKVITKISYGGYKLGANSANILVQDRITGQINEERMSVYVRLGIRLLYKGLRGKDMEKKRIRKLLKSLSFKQGRKYDDPVSAREIQGFINFHQLDMSEVLKPVDQFKNFNEFFYRELKPNARPCSAPDNPRIIVSPADCRSVVFDTLDEATKIWIKGREFSVTRLLGNAYLQDAKRYLNGSLGIFRLAPQDYHRFHIPVDGVMDKPKLIEGEYYTVNPMAIRSALDVYSENVRIVVPIDSVAHGRVMVICVGAMMVGSTVITRNAGDRVKRAEELGYFKFGGSTVLLLFEPGVMKFDDDLVVNSNGALETLLRVGMSIGHHPEQSQYAPDMRKNEENVTLEERQEAKRRIEGSLAPLPGSSTIR